MIVLTFDPNRPRAARASTEDAPPAAAQLAPASRKVFYHPLRTAFAELDMQEAAALVALIQQDLATGTKRRDVDHGTDEATTVRVGAVVEAFRKLTTEQQQDVAAMVIAIADNERPDRTAAIRRSMRVFVRRTLGPEDWSYLAKMCITWIGGAK